MSGCSVVSPGTGVVTILPRWCTARSRMPAFFAASTLLRNCPSCLLFRYSFVKLARRGGDRRAAQKSCIQPRRKPLISRPQIGEKTAAQKHMILGSPRRSAAARFTVPRSALAPLSPVLTPKARKYSQPGKCPAGNANVVSLCSETAELRAHLVYAEFSASRCPGDGRGVRYELGRTSQKGVLSACQRNSTCGCESCAKLKEESSAKFDVERLRYTNERHQCQEI